MVRNPFEAIRERLAVVLLDVEYARRQLRQRDGRARALDALDRIKTNLEDEVEAPELPEVDLDRLRTIMDRDAERMHRETLRAIEAQAEAPHGWDHV